ncbi:hypothetical protein BpOF4_08755 [Alkalihalophilus pseudofirmus OF4]|uniref:DUF2521 domain-containing protein n=1 Tax=Alkalihalophilus pseudofirmus (strain ATCC BAA-2126 / JCM 17055 / OF4) TaxID=398511 RepID=D3FRP9_ALKPO|nr:MULTISPECIES: YbaK family protein [Alkalihalophilus]ADC49809.1 hypothetical protein BpOF4_08755 [Alkalihalophilus pseudofirmus OF4]MED1600811.1 YbaK family protein [Alkalihalophilus marmarensis]
MAVVSTFSEKRREKQWKFERGVLRQLSLKQLKEDVHKHFKPVVPFYFLSHPFLLDPCMDMAIDAYLVGAEYGRFGYLGESVSEVMARCEDELTDISFSLFNLLQGWNGDTDYLLESLKISSDVFIDRWWEKGFKEAEKRHRLRLH